MGSSWPGYSVQTGKLAGVKKWNSTLQIRYNILIFLHYPFTKRAQIPRPEKPTLPKLGSGTCHIGAIS
jgi:hypothetical protein